MTIRGIARFPSLAVQDPTDPGAIRADSSASDQEPSRPRLRTVSGRRRPDFGRRPERPQATPHRHAGVPSVMATNTATAGVTARCNATCSSINAAIKKPSYPRFTSRPTPRSRLRPRPTSTAPREDARSSSWSLPGPTRIHPHPGTPSSRAEAILEGMVAAFEFFWKPFPRKFAGQSQNGRDLDP